MLMEDLEKIKFEKALSARRHKEMTERLDAMTNILASKPNDNVKEAIEKLSDDLISFLKETRSKETVKIEDKVVISESKTEQAILNSLNELKKAFELSQKPKKWVHTVTKRAYSGHVDEITSSQII